MTPDSVLSIVAMIEAYDGPCSDFPSQLPMDPTLPPSAVAPLRFGFNSRSVVPEPASLIPSCGARSQQHSITSSGDGFWGSPQSTVELRRNAKRS